MYTTRHTTLLLPKIAKECRSTPLNASPKPTVSQWSSIVSTSGYALCFYVQDMGKACTTETTKRWQSSICLGSQTQSPSTGPP